MRKMFEELAETKNRNVDDRTLCLMKWFTLWSLVGVWMYGFPYKSYPSLSHDACQLLCDLDLSIKADISWS